MKTIDFANGGFVHLTWRSVSLHIAGLGFYFGWFPDLDLIGLQIMFFEWVADSHLVPFRFQLLYFLFALHMDAN